MITLKRIQLQNQKVLGEEPVEETIFKAPYKPWLWHDMVTMQRRRLRQGTHSTKTRAEVSGTGKKPFRQKGTGQARQGTLIGPHQVGGGIAFGPKPRDYKTKLNKNVRKMALWGALSQKNFEGKLAVIDAFEVPSGKTKEAAQLLSSFKEQSVLIVGNCSPMTLRSVRNISWCKILSPAGLNVFDLFRFDHVFLTKDGLSMVQKEK